PRRPPGTPGVGRAQPDAPPGADHPPRAGRRAARRPAQPHGLAQREPLVTTATVAVPAVRRRGLVARARRAWQINAAFTWLGYTEELAYPLNFALKQLQP